MYTTTDTIAAPATPPGVSAIAVIRMSGPDAIKIAGSVFKSNVKDWNKVKGYTVHFGRFTDMGGNLVDEAIATVFRAPKSFTGEDAIEFSFHGSEYIRKRAMEVLTEAGARSAGPGEFTLRAFLNGKMDLSQAEAVADLIASNSAQSHRLAIEQMRGGYSAKLESLRQQLVEFAALLELELDFSEEDVEFADRTKLSVLLETLTGQLDKLSASFAAGNVIREGIPVAIIGKPNAGKSTLLNAILQEERAIVSEIAGTTRDTVEEVIVLSGMRFRFIDTAGLRETTDTIESIGVSRSYEKSRLAPVVLYLFDPGTTTAEALTEELQAVTAAKTETNGLLLPVANKSDLFPAIDLKEKYSSIPDILFISAKKHDHLDEMLNRLTTYAAAIEAQATDITVTNVRHKHAIDNALSALLKVREGIASQLTTDLLAIDIRDALNFLGEITGTVASDEILGTIFSRFCIGK
ncbi:MAG TPA: tRNA uridine-5-carboxymethylaminomethyl(34) synthesis GTPase MnmE [Bacteroidia bacterium]|nr:tRNA uridine-5-carboxymethylaminomethyl(34) synthesis GTPase MnmE [Bacteroidia bacterium]